MRYKQRESYACVGLENFVAQRYLMKLGVPKWVKRDGRQGRGKILTEKLCETYLGAVDYHLDARRRLFKLLVRGGRDDSMLIQRARIAHRRGASGASRFFQFKICRN
jgi:hypothetical protein